MFRVTLNYKRKLKGNLGYRLVSIIIITIIIKSKLKVSLSKWAKNIKTSNNARSDVVLMPVIPALGLMKCIIIGGGGGDCATACVERSEENIVESVLSFHLYVGSGESNSGHQASMAVSAVPPCWSSTPAPGNPLLKIKNSVLTKVWKSFCGIYSKQVCTPPHRVPPLGNYDSTGTETPVQKAMPCLSIMVAVNSWYLDIIHMSSTEEWVCVV